MTAPMDADLQAAVDRAVALFESTPKPFCDACEVRHASDGGILCSTCRAQLAGQTWDCDFLMGAS